MTIFPTDGDESSKVWNWFFITRRKGDILLGPVMVKYDRKTSEFYDEWRENGYTQTES